MTYKQIFNAMIAFLLVFMVIVSPALAAEPKDEITIERGSSNNDNNVDDHSKVNSDESVSDKLLSDDKFLGFDRKHDYDPFQDISVQNAIDLAASLPIWPFAVAFILVLFIAMILIFTGVISWNTAKGGKAATSENPVKAAQGIKETKMVNRAYTGEVLEAGFFIAGIIFLVTLLK